MRGSSVGTIINILTGDKSSLYYNVIHECPICKSKISAEFVGGSLNTNNTATVLFFCPSCHESFLTKYQVLLQNSTPRCEDYTVQKLMYSEPNRFCEKVFNERLASLSPRFVKIYNQALAAESSQLDEIAGMGYRKALEFLVKDYAIHINPDEEEEIKKKKLSACIKNYIGVKRIVDLAEKSAWIGNDETHYERRQETLDINKMKEFIEALVYFVSMDLVAEEASKIE